MIVHTLAVGLNDQQTKRQERPNDYYLNVVYTETASRFDGATVTPVHGVYKHLNGETVVENTIKIELLLPDTTTNGVKVHELITILKDRFNQESILYLRHPADMQFV